MQPLCALSNVDMFQWILLLGGGGGGGGARHALNLSSRASRMIVSITFFVKLSHLIVGH